ncbi:MAG: glutamate-5-semialdehyde dehydrogenase [Actinomycetota bacterium]
MTETPTPIPELARRAKAATAALTVASTAEKDAALEAAADLLEAHAESIIDANALDVASAHADGMDPGLVDRLRLDPGRIAAMASGLRQVAALRDPIGEITEGWVRPNGLRIEKTRVPLGVVAIIYESRPNVTSDAFGLCLKSGNVAFLRGSSSAINSNLAIAAVLREALPKAGLPADALVVVDDTRREAATEFMQQRGYVDCLIPRGGPSLIQSILDNATVPYVIDGAGNCHIYVDAAADLDMAREITHNAKTQRIGVCNAAESLVVHADVADVFLPMVATALADVELVGDDRARAVVDMAAASEADFATEFLSMKMSVKVVDDLDAAITHVNETSTGHSEAIITNDVVAADRFAREVDAAAVLVNASTRFVDGEEFGFGAEIGISTQKLHARGPMGLEQLTTEKFIVRGTGQVRG